MLQKRGTLKENLSSVVADWNPTSHDKCHHNRSEALANYRAGKADLWFFHITHHAGTTILQKATANGLSEIEERPPKRFKETFDSKLLHMWGETTKGRPDKLPVSSLIDFIPCTSNNFVSMIILRDPISRILASDAMWTTTTTEHVDDCNTDNYGMRWLTGKGGGVKLTLDDLKVAKQRLDMFDIVLITENITQTSKMLCRDLGWKDCLIKQRNHPRPVEVLPASLFERWTKRNYFELELYKYAVKRSNAMMASSDATLSVLDVENRGGVVFDASSDESNMRWLC
jgi:hypothetical protein